MSNRKQITWPGPVQRGFGIYPAEDQQNALVLRRKHLRAESRRSLLRVQSQGKGQFPVGELVHASATNDPALVHQVQPLRDAQRDKDGGQGLGPSGLPPFRGDGELAPVSVERNPVEPDEVGLVEHERA